MMTSPKPTIVIIPGAHLSSAFYTPTVDALRSLGFDTYALPHQTVGRRPSPAPTMLDDAAFIAAQVQKLADSGREVILIAHSYGGLPMTEATKGLTVQERSASGLKGGITRLVYVAAQVREVGQPLMSANKEQWPPFLKDETQDYIPRDLPVSTISMAFPEWPVDEARKAATFYQEQSRWIYFGQLSWAGYSHVPCTYVLTTKDVAAPLEKQRERIAVLQKHSPSVDIIEIESGHMPMATAPEKFVQVVAEIAGRAQGN